MKPLRILVTAGALVGVAIRLPAQTGDPAPHRQVALTFDDLPLGQGQPGIRCDADALLDVARKMTTVVRAEKAPSAVFVTTGNVRDRLRASVLPAVIETWENAGAVIGNHGHRHLSLSRVPLAEYIADVSLADSILRNRTSARYFRHPFLHLGLDTATASSMNRWLADHGYTVAPVTIDNNEWVYARAYTLALGRGDSAMVRRLVPAYLRHIDQALAFAESLAVRVTGAEIPQVMLLHANELNRDHLGEVIEVMKRRGYRFISLERALEHPAYQRRTWYAGPWGISWILRWSPDRTVWRMDLPGVEEWVEQ